MAPLPMLAGAGARLRQPALRVCCALWRGGFFAPAAGDLSGLVYEEVFGAESSAGPRGINFFTAFRLA